MQVGDRFTGLSILGTRFDCRIEAEAMVGDIPAIRPSVAGRAWITETRQILLDPDDPFPRGYRLSDTWPA